MQLRTLRYSSDSLYILERFLAFSRFCTTDSTVANIRGQVKRAYLQSLTDAVVDGNASVDLASGVDANLVQVLTLEGALKAFQRLGFNQLKEGKMTVSVAGQSHEAKYALPESWRSLDQESVFALAQEFREVRDDAMITLSALGDDDPDDITIMRTMMADDRMQSVTSAYKDHSIIRFGNRF